MARRKKSETVKLGAATAKAGAKLSRGLSTEQKEILRKAAALKKRGLISSRIDLRSYTPTKYMKQKIRKLEGVLSGAQQVLRVSKEQAKLIQSQYRKSPGIFSANGKIVVNTPGGERVQYDDHLIKTTRRLGSKGAYVEAIRIPVNVNDPYEILEWLNSSDAAKAKYAEEYYGFRIYGNASFNAFPDVQSLINYLLTYSDFEQMRDKTDFELFRTYPPEAWETMAETEAAPKRAAAEQRDNEKRKAGKKERRKANATGRSVGRPRKHPEQITLTGKSYKEILAQANAFETQRLQDQRDRKRKSRAKLK